MRRRWADPDYSARMRSNRAARRAPAKAATSRSSIPAELRQAYLRVRRKVGLQRARQLLEAHLTHGAKEALTP